MGIFMVGGLATISLQKSDKRVMKKTNTKKIPEASFYKKSSSVGVKFVPNGKRKKNLGAKLSPKD
jgi:hypothetical protein